jgi:hypothetical protein
MTSSSEQIAIAQHPDGFVLYRRRLCREWLNLKLVSLTPRRKNNWWFGWNGERFSRSSDARLLSEYYLKFTPGLPTS